MKITVLGWYGHSNTGDDAYELAFPLLFPNAKLTFVDKLPRNLKADAIILGGGDVLYDSFPKQLTFYPSVPKYAFSVSVRNNGVLPDVVFKKIIGRDDSGVKGCSWLPDFTFVLTPNANNGKQILKRIFESQKADLYQTVCAVVINANLMVKENTLARDSAAFEKMAFDLAKLMDNTSASFLFLPFGSGFPFNDRITNSIVYSRCKFFKKNAIVYDKYTPQEILDVISAVDLTISSRLHSSVFSCIGGTPFIDLTHHDKNRHFLQTIGKQNWSIDYWHFCMHECERLMEKLLTNQLLRKELLTLSHVYRMRLQNAIPSLIV